MSAATATLPETSFPSIPPFPTTVPTAPLHRISLSSLSAGDKSESARLFAASTSLGFFYLDLRNDDTGRELLAEADSLFKIGEELFELGREELGRYDYSVQGSYFGYKGFGTAYVDEKGGLDRNEFYNAGKDDFLSQSPSPFAHPALLQTTHAPLLRSYMRNAHALVTLILTHLNTHLDLPEGTLQRLHDQKIISGDHVRFIKAPPQPEDDLRTAMGQHTDFGSVTILFNRVGGLQVLPPSLSDSSSGSSEWLYVRPLPGHCIVNLGDAMVAFTNGLLRSNLHRVVAPPGEQARCTRYALVYFARPGDEVPLKRIEAGSSVIPPLASGMVEGGLPSKEHIRRMALGKRVGVSDVPKYLPGEMDERREEVLAN